MERGNRCLQYWVVSSVSLAASIGGILFSWATPVLPKIAAKEVDLQINNAEISWMVAISSFGFVVGSCLSRTISDKWGRRISFLGSTLPILAGSVMMIFAWEVWLLSSARFLWGLGTGMVGAVSALYIAEIVDKEIRGSMSLANRCMMSFGCVLVITVGAFVSYQTLNYLMLVLPPLLLISCWWIPESPYYLLKQEKVNAARKTLQKLTGIRDEEVLEEKIKQMQSHVRIEMSQSDTVKEFLTGKRYRKAIGIVAGLRVPQILTGLHAVQNYLGPILIESHSGINITLALIIFGGCRFLLGVMSSIVVDKVGRRPLLVSSFFGTGVVLGIVAAYFGIHNHYEVTYPFTLVPFIGIILAVIISNLGYESVAYLVPSELFPLNVKAIAMSTVSVSGGVINFISVKTYQQIKDWIGLCGVFVLYAAAAFIGAALCYLLVPETKGKSLKEIQIELNGNIYEEEEKLNNIAVNNDKEGGDKADC